MEPIEVLRSALAEIDDLVRGQGPGSTIGVIDDHPGDGGGLDGTLRSLRIAVVVHELDRRMPGHVLRAFTSAPSLPIPGMAAVVIEPLPSPGASASGHSLPVQVDSTVLVGGASDALDPPTRRLMDEGIPDPLVLIGRSAPSELLDSRRAYLELTGRIPPGTRYVLCLPAESAGDELEKAADDALVVVRPDSPPSPADLLGLVHSATAVITSSAPMAAIAVGLGRPVILQPFSDIEPWTHEVGADRIEDFRAVVDGATGVDRRSALMDRLDRRFDDLCNVLERDSAATVARTTERVASLVRRLAAVEAANVGLLEVLQRERTVLSSELQRRRTEEVPEEQGLAATVLARQLAVEQQTATELRAEIDRIYSTRTMRMMSPVRRAYGRLGHRLR